MVKFSEIFNSTKPIIGVVHLLPLPGTPHYDPNVPVGDVIERAKRETKTLIENGFDGIVFANEGDRPYITQVGPEIIASYVRIVTEVLPNVTIPYGCGVLMDPIATFAIAKAIDAKFVRTYVNGTFTGTFGYHNFNPGSIFRYRKMIDADNIPMFCNFTAHAGVSFDSRPLEEIVDGVLPVIEPDAVLVPGPRAGLPPNFNDVENLKNRFPAVPILITSGINTENVKEAMEICDGIIVGTNIKKDGVIWNEICPKRAEKFIKIAKDL
ncbi:MAG TPA: BtpA/SgcQ family protein [Thermoanaerobacterales bacterium]|nr:BtpA/SgcQ family protein [Thermoanaerobacterales bacterium]